MEKVAGYIIVRKPQFNEIIPGGTFLKPVNGIFYHGIDRCEWEDLRNDYFEKKLPGNLLEIYKKLRESGNDGTFREVGKSIADMIELLNLEKDKNEIIVVSSPMLDNIKGSILLRPESVGWLGYDIVQVGGWSLIRHAIFENQQLGLLQKNKLNDYGLFDNPDMEEFISQYNELGKQHKVDPLLNVLKVELVRIGNYISFAY